MKMETVEIPAAVLSSVETLDELQDWLTAQNPKLIAELRAARKEDLAGKFKPWKPRHHESGALRNFRPSDLDGALTD